MGRTATSGRSGRGLGALGALALALGGCGEESLPGHYWELQFSTAEDRCNSPSVSYGEGFTYRLEFDVTEVRVAIGSDVFASGTINGCTVAYESVVWTESRPAGDVLWSLSGEAIAQRGDGSCGIQSDWVGTEVFTIHSSADPAISPGCTYTLDVNGTYEGEVE